MSWLAKAWARIVGATATSELEPEVCAHKGEFGGPCHCPSDCACRGYSCLIVHYAPDATGYPTCGARVGAPWALNIEAVTCPECRQIGMLAHMHYWVNTR